MASKKKDLLWCLQTKLASEEEVAHCIIGSRNKEYFQARVGRILIVWLLANFAQRHFRGHPD